MCSYFSPYPFISFLFIIIFFHDFPISFGEDDYRFLNCSRGVFECGDVKDIGYPFWGNGRAQYCGHPDFALKCEEEDEIQIVIQGQNYHVLNIFENNHTLRMRTMNPINNNCPARLANISLPNNLFNYSPPSNQNITLLYDCPSSIPQLIGNTIPCLTNGTHTSYYSLDYLNIRLPGDVWSCATVVKVPILQAILTTYIEFIQSMEVGFDVTYVVVANNSECIQCANTRGQCGYDRGMQPTCFCSDGPYQGNCTNKPPDNSRANTRGSKKTTKVLIGVGTGIGGILLTCIIFILYKRHKRNKLASSSALISRDISRDLSSKPDLEKGSTYFQTPIFTYKELDEATNHFDSSKELGDGGFGTVYHGKLRDGRVVAVKRLFEHNYKRVDQFLNEIQILSRLRHQNLVSLYGCTNRHSRELLLVYEYVPNGTVADHLHGDRAKDGLLTWPVRMTIAIESADALAYLHASDIIHRDVKTNNILLDTAFHVKVADFGLSRLFPTDVTHVSTAPQGTPGYVDPEYYQCYQLNDRSDVYSFGVVLIELISSKPAVDIGRHRHEINLANMAINKIHNRALHELVDLSLGFNSDFAVRNMITLVAELAFRCLQQEKEMRPCMVEVLEILRGIGSEEYKKKTTEEMDISADARLLKNSLPLSPDSVTDKWVSKSTTPNTSG